MAGWPAIVRAISRRAAAQFATVAGEIRRRRAERAGALAPTAMGQG
jgi:hypothetical protein